jgi:hypothetical protein
LFAVACFSLARTLTFILTTPCRYELLSPEGEPVLYKIIAKEKILQDVKDQGVFNDFSDADLFKKFKVCCNFLRALFVACNAPHSSMF